MRGEFVDVGGVRLYCYASGSRGIGEPIVLIHGAFTSSHIWKDLLPRLPQGHRVLVFDLLGHGRSDPPRLAPMTVGDHATRVRHLMDIMGVSTATLVGHGMGAAIALTVAGQAPERVSRLVLVDPDLIAAEQYHASARVRRQLRGRLSVRMTRVALFEPLWRRLAPGWLASELHSAMLSAYARRDIGVRALDSYLVNYRTRDGRESACAQLRALKRTTREPTLDTTPPLLRCPITLAVGMLASRRSQHVTKQLLHYLPTRTTGDVSVHQLAGVAHMAPEESPDRLGTVIGALLEPPAHRRDTDSTSNTSAEFPTPRTL